MKNSARKNNPQTVKNKKAASSNKSATAKKPAKERETLYQVKPNRDSDVIKAFITFTYRISHPRVTGRMIFYGLLVFFPGFFIKIKAVSIACFIVGALIILLALFRQYISLALTKRNDPDYKSGADFTYDFTEADASFYRNDELIAYLAKYKDILSFYYDDKFYYLAISNRDLFILPKSRFTIGDPADFEDFIYKKSKQTCKWIPDKFSDQIKKRRAVRALSNNDK